MPSAPSNLLSPSGTLSLCELSISPPFLTQFTKNVLYEIEAFLPLVIYVEPYGRFPRPYLKPTDILPICPNARLALTTFHFALLYRFGHLRETTRLIINMFI